MRTDIDPNSKAWDFAIVRVGRNGNSLCLTGMTGTLKDLGYVEGDEVAIAVLGKDYEAIPVLQVRKKRKKEE